MPPAREADGAHEPTIPEVEHHPKCGMAQRERAKRRQLEMKRLPLDPSTAHRMSFVERGRRGRHFIPLLLVHEREELPTAPP